jgi:outer membrane protein assembly factor BamB
VVGTVFAMPWLPRPDPAGASLERYQPSKDGASVLFAKLDEGDEVQSWSSQNRAKIPWLGLYNDLRKAPSEHLFALYGRPDFSEVSFTEQLRRNEARGQIFTTRLRELGQTGAVTETTFVSLRDERGELLVSFYSPDEGDVLLDPPILTLPADLEPGRRWESEGRLGSVTYRWRADVAEAAARESRVGSFDDCLRVETRLSLARGQTPFRETAGSDWYCAEVGLVENSERDLATGLTTRSVLVGRSGAAGAVELQPAAAALPSLAEGSAGTSATPPTLAAGSAGTATGRDDMDALDGLGSMGEPDRWVLTRVGRGRIAGDAGESTIPPLWIPSESPLLLVAGYAGDLLALDAGDDLGTIRWRFHPPSTLYGPPAYDPVRGRIYVGAGNRHLYALDVRGLFLWSFETGDNVATRPLVLDVSGLDAAGVSAGEDRASPAGRGRAHALVVFGSEDGTVYALDADSGQERWRTAAAGPIVSSPIGAGDAIAVGSDDGTVHGLDPATGQERWQYRAGGAIEAPIVAGDDGRLFVVSRDGTLAAVDPSACEKICESAWEAKVGGILRQAPAVGTGRVFVVNDDGYLAALDAETGRRLWSLPQPGFVGPPALVGDVLVVARTDGDIVRLDLEGVEQGRWSGAEAVGPLDVRPKFAYGPTAGGGALWLADDGAVIRRLGPPGPLGDVVSLRAATMVRSSQPPLDGGLLIQTPVEYQGAAAVLDPSRNVYLIDPVSGRGERRATVGGDSIVWLTDPVVAGDTLLATIGTTLQAVDLRTGGALWATMSGGLSLRPPTVDGDTVLWLTTQDAMADASSAAGAAGESDATGESGGAAASSARGTLRAFALTDGRPRWQAPSNGYAAIGGAVVHEGTVFVSSPPAAYDLALGSPRWSTRSAEIGGLGLGGPGLDPGGATLFVALLQPSTDTGRIVALDAGDGRVRWRASLGTELLRDTERLWLDDDTLIVPTQSGAVLGLAAASGEERWRYQPSAPRLGSVTVADGRVWLVLENARIVGLDAQTGRPVMRFRDLNVGLNGQGLNQRPALIGGRLLVAIGRMLLGFPLP